jgi:hypothetical protein
VLSRKAGESTAVVASVLYEAFLPRERAMSTCDGDQSSNGRLGKRQQRRDWLLTEII